MKNNEKYFRYFGYNTYRLITSGAVFAAVIIINIINPSFYFKLPKYIYILFTLYYSIFPVKDMIRQFNKTRYKGKQFAKNYNPVSGLSDAEFKQIKKKYDMGAVRSMVFWILFMAAAGLLYFNRIIGKEWIVFLFAMSDFCVYFAIFFWCPFHKILLKPHCCMDCRIFNWDSFFSFSFLIFIPSIYTYILFALGIASLVMWEVNYHKEPKRFYKLSNETLNCENCDMEHCKNRSCQTAYKGNTSEPQTRSDSNASAQEFKTN